MSDSFRESENIESLGVIGAIPLMPRRKRLQPNSGIAAGNVNGSSLNNRGGNVNVWSRSRNSSTNAWKLNSNSGNLNVNTNNRFNGFSVRGVRVQHLLLI